jgi:hypothetical protein
VVGVRKSKMVDNGYFKTKSSAIVSRMARVVERLIGPLPEFHRNTYRFTPAIRIEIIRLHGSGVGNDTIARRLNINPKSVQLWIKRYNEKRNLQPKVNADGRPSLTTEDENFLLACSGYYNAS